ncbi:hypothetical protein KPH14_012269 [Odynerus spinipes]|uniref:DUF7041 domain-containing protein n=1 Tax=Odynerus spinipes TaxID=1348599 RepID=A0AAD9RFI8_9HYME|nr:hypothetical protein KPH14_012269 [Odynerus spinipes]
MPISRSPERSSGAGMESGEKKEISIKADEAQGATSKVEVGPSDQVEGASLSIVQAPRFPPFSKEYPDIWFTHVEMAFATNRISSDESKFRHVAMHLDTSIWPLVADLLRNPPGTNKYQAIKDRVINSLGESQASKLRRLLGTHELGDEKPSNFLQRLRNLADGQVSDEVLRAIFMEQMPENIRGILAISEVKEMERLAAQADKILEMARPVISSVQSTSITPPGGDLFKEIAELRAQIERLGRQSTHRSRSKSRGTYRKRYSRSKSREKNRDGFCYYHHKFGKDARHCTTPCSWQKEPQEN